MNKKLIIALLSTLVMCILAGCSADNSDATKENKDTIQVALTSE